MVKPAGSACKSDCTNCFYLSKQTLPGGPGGGHMDEEVLERFVRDYIQSVTGDEVVFSWQGGEPTLLGREFLGKGVAIEHDGSAYACDHYVYPEYRLGNIRQQSLGDLVFSRAQVKFGYAKSEKLPAYCKRCEVLGDCWGECPKNRLLRTPDGEPGLNYLCPGLKRFFARAVPTAKKWRHACAQFRRCRSRGIEPQGSQRESRASDSRSPPLPLGEGLGVRKPVMARSFIFRMIRKARSGDPNVIDLKRFGNGQ